MSEAAIHRDAPPPDPGDAMVHPGGSFRRGALRWGYFVVLNAVAATVAVAFFVGLLFYGEGLDPYLQGTYEWLLAHPGVTSVLAFTPLASSLLVGYGYAQRARRRKALAAKAAARPAPTPDEEHATQHRTKAAL